MADYTARCTVCTDPYTDTVRKKVRCSFCEYECCTRCLKTYFLNSTSAATEFECLNCKKPWTLDFVSTFIALGWIHGDYKTHKRDLLLDQEKSMLPHSQHMVSNYRLCQDLEKQAQILDKEILERQNELRVIRNNIYDLKTNRYMGFGTSGQQQQERRAFIKACPVEDCRGFLNNQYHCGVCDAFACSSCNEVKPRGEEHVCDPNKVASVQLIAKDSKPCPNCASVIYKQSGCDYMWCTQCHTSFSWKTGRIEKGVNHNPHYYDYLRTHGGQIPRAPGDEVCGGMPGYHQIAQKLVALNVDKQLRTQIMECHRILRHIRLTMIVPVDRSDFANADIRLKYLIKEIDDDEFGRLVYNRYIDRLRKDTFNGLYGLAADIGEDLFRRLVAAKSASFIYDFCKEYKALKDYINRHLEEYGRLYKVKPRMIPWSMIVEY